MGSTWNAISRSGSSSASARVVRSSDAFGVSAMRPTISFSAVAAKNALSTMASRNPYGSAMRLTVTNQPAFETVSGLRDSSSVMTPWNTRIGTVSVMAGT